MQTRPFSSFKSPSAQPLFARAVGVVVMLALAACTTPESDKIADAQDCLDRSTSTTALACMSKVEGLTSASSELIRCSAYFIDQGFSEASRLSEVAEQMSSTDGNQDGSTITALSFMAFSAEKYDMTKNFELSEAAFASCSKSSSSGLIYLSSMARIATSAMNVIPGYDPRDGVAPTPEQVEEALCDPSRSAVTSIAIGSAAQVAYEQNCLGKDITNDPACLQFQAAVNAGTTPEQIGDGLAEAICTTP